MWNIVPVKSRRCVPSNVSSNMISDRFLEDSVSRLFTDFMGAPASTGPAVEVMENEQELLFEVELPGVEEKELSIHVESRILTISGEKKSDSREGKTVRSERWFGKFTRRFRLPETADSGAIEAKLRNGVLTVRVPRQEAAKPRRVDVQVV